MCSESQQDILQGEWVDRGVPIGEILCIDLFHVSGHLDQFEGSLFLVKNSYFR